MTPSIGSSDVASILGVSPWRSPMATWARLVGLVERETDIGAGAKKRGVRMEAALRNWYAEEAGRCVEPGPTLQEEPWRSWTYEWAHARPDGYCYEDGALVLVECKTVRRFDESWGDDGSDGVPVYYYVQALWQLGIARQSGRSAVRCDLVAFCPMSEETRTYRIAFDEVRWGQLFARVAAWYARHVEGGEPPPVDGLEATTDVLGRIYPGNVPAKAIDATEDDVALARRAIAARSAKEAAAAIEAQATNELRERIGRAGATEIAGVARWTPVKGRRLLDADLLAERYPEAFAACSRAGDPSRRFTLILKEA